MEFFGNFLGRISSNADARKPLIRNLRRGVVGSAMTVISAVAAIPVMGGCINPVEAQGEFLAIKADGYALPCSEIASPSSFDENYYCSGVDDDEVVDLPSMVYVGEERTAILGLLGCILEPLDVVIMETDDGEVYRHKNIAFMGGLARLGDGYYWGGSTFSDPGNKNPNEIFVSTEVWRKKQGVDEEGVDEDRFIGYLSAADIACTTAHEAVHGIGGIPRHVDATLVDGALDGDEGDDCVTFQLDQAAEAVENVFINGELDKETMDVRAGQLAETDQRCADELALVRAIPIPEYPE